MEIEFQESLEENLTMYLGKELAEECTYETEWDEWTGKCHLDFGLEVEGMDFNKPAPNSKYKEDVLTLCKMAIGNALFETYDIDLHLSAIDDCIVGDTLSLSCDYKAD